MNDTLLEHGRPEVHGRLDTDEAVHGGADVEADRVVQVMIVDDHRLIRAGLQSVLDLAAGVEVIWSVDGGSSALTALRLRRPDVVLMDLSMPDMDGVEATARVIAHDPTISVVVLTSYCEPQRVRDAIDAGAMGYLLKDTAPDRLVEAIHAAARGESPLDPRAAPALIRRPFDGPGARAGGVEVLSGREREVLVLVAQGLLTKQVARRLSIREATVKAHLTRIFQRLGVADRTQASLWAHRNGLLDHH